MQTKNEKLSLLATHRKDGSSSNNVFLSRKELVRNRILRLDEELRGIRSLRSERPDLYEYFEKFLLRKLTTLVIRYRRKYDENPLEVQ